MPAVPALVDLQAGAHVLSVPLRERFRGIVRRETLLLQGPVGWGEFAPFVEYDDAEAARWLAAAVEAAWTGWPAPSRTRVPVNATVPAVPPERVPQVLARFPGCTTVKVKVAEPGQRLEDDLARVAAVRRALGPTGRLRVDANGGWTLAQARAALDRLDEHDLEYAEQPCAELADLAALRGRGVLIAADESIRKAADPLRVAVAGAADLVVLKVAPLGGVRPALAVAKACGLPVVVSSALETSVGIAAGLALAAALPALPYACGLATTGLFSADVTDRPVTYGALTPGLVAPDPAALSTLAAPPDRRQWWLDRLARCHARLPPTGG